MKEVVTETKEIINACKALGLVIDESSTKSPFYHLIDIAAYAEDIEDVTHENVIKAAEIYIWANEIVDACESCGLTIDGSSKPFGNLFSIMTHIMNFIMSYLGSDDEEKYADIIQFLQTEPEKTELHRYF